MFLEYKAQRIIKMSNHDHVEEGHPPEFINVFLFKFVRRMYLEGILQFNLKNENVKLKGQIEKLARVATNMHKELTESKHMLKPVIKSTV